MKKRTKWVLELQKNEQMECNGCDALIIGPDTVVLEAGDAVPERFKKFDVTSLVSFTTCVTCATKKETS